MREESLRATPLGHGNRALLRMLNHNGLEDRREARTDARVASRAELSNCPAL